MIPRECKRLAEVDFPIAAVSRHAVREKATPSGHPSRLHLWWARRPLASSRAKLLGLILPDPCDKICPQAFKTEARRALLEMQGRPRSWEQDTRDDAGLRRTLLRFIGDFSSWDHAGNSGYLATARALVRAAHVDVPPLIVDPFAGGGSIPLEALRVGCEAFASDLNPVACLILKVMLEDIPRHGPGQAEELRRVGAEIKRQAEAELANLYPQDPDGATPIAYLWARTVRCEAPICGAEIPLVRSYWLCKKPSRRRALRPNVVRPRGGIPRVTLELFEPASERQVLQGTVSRAKAACPACNIVLRPERVRAQLADQRGGADVVFDDAGYRVGGARLLAVVTLRPGEAGRHYRLPDDGDYKAVQKAQQRLASLLEGWERGGRDGLCPVPDEPTPQGGGSGAGRAFSVQRYGMLKWSDLFTARQKVALAALCEHVASSASRDCWTLLACALSRVSMSAMSCTRWNATAEKMQHTFGRQALPIVWDFAEVVVSAEAPGNWKSGYELTADVIEAARSYGSGLVQAADAAKHPMPDETAHVWFTDPPYYDAVPYADLSDFFLVWLKRALPGHPLLCDPFDPANRLSPKRQEAVQDETKKDDGRVKDRTWFEETMAKAFAEGRRILREDGVGSVVFAHKTTEGWEALLSGMIRGGWTITGSWPIATEMTTRLRARESAALATSVHLICRPRPDDAPVGDWSEVYRELPRRVGRWMEHLQAEGVRGADLVFACIGPAIEIYSRYSRVVDAQERMVPLGGDPETTEPHRRGFLAYVWEVIGRMALEQILGTAEARARNGGAGAVEEDARLTALFLWTLQATDEDTANGNGEGDETDEIDEDDDEPVTRRKKPKGVSLVFDVVRRFAQPLGIHLPEWEGRIIATEKGAVRLLPVSERAQQLFGKEGASTVADQLERASEPGTVQLSLFAVDETPVARSKGRKRRGASTDVPDTELRTRRQATTLDRVHAAMLLQAAGRANALRALLRAEVERGPDFVRLANSLSALYPRDSEEKRLLDAMLLAVPR